AGEKVADRYFLLEAEVKADEFPVTKSGEEKRRLAQGLRRQRSRVGRRAAEDRLLLDEGDFLAKIRRQSCTLFPSGARADHDQVELVRSHGRLLALLSKERGREGHDTPKDCESQSKEASKLTSSTLRGKARSRDPNSLVRARSPLGPR